ncbi:ThiF family adenylyltransferase [Neptunomonas japonica]|uniref:ThiF family adenylyltransferase n=1 Tax=Neptunomonas japonica TaxID=417574 RepID=UPI00040B4EBA|nr:ThiF family adenylyltransferase [Neptunomonas japonica]
MNTYYETAVCRNLGLVNPDEQQKLLSSRVAVAGLGGLGGINLLTLVRMGIGAFNIADLDEFSAANSNRQIGATSSTVDRKKTEVLAEMAKDIHPSLSMEVFNEGVQPENVHAFLKDVDVVIDSIDFFQMEARRLLHKTARELKIPVVFSAPLGFSGTLHIFTADSMSFDEYFDIDDEMDNYNKLVAFAVGLCPRGTHWKYMDSSKVDLTSQSGPSLSSACNIASGLLTTEALCLLLNRDERQVKAAPHYTQFDPYRRIYRTGYLRFGNRGPIQKLKKWLVARQFRDQADALNQK